MQGLSPNAEDELLFPVLGVDVREADLELVVVRALELEAEAASGPFGQVVELVAHVVLAARGSCCFFWKAAAAASLRPSAAALRGP